MVYGIWLSADAILAQQYRQDVIANNLANVDTPGFKPDRVAFVERLNESMIAGSPTARHPVLDGSTGGVFGMPVYTDFSQGGIVPSDNPLDTAIQGDGFLSVHTPDGVRYTRDGRLVMDEGGVLRHEASGGAVVDLQGRPIVVDAFSGEAIKIDRAGRVTQDGNLIGALALVDFEDRQDLEKVGQNLYRADGARPIDAAGQVRQFAYEASGADPTATLVEMIAATRAYEMSATLVSMQDESLGRLVNDVGRIG